MDTLVPNPDGCKKFEPNQFKKEKCKNCGRPWQEHQGAISEALVSSYTGAKKKAADEKAQKEADAKAKLKAKAAAKKEAQQAVEDAWLFDSKDGTKGSVSIDSDDDDDMGFRMFTAQDLAQAPIESRVAEGFKPLKVKNLIDFEECDVPEDLGSSASSAPPVQKVPSQSNVLASPSCSAAATSSSSSTALPSAKPPGDQADTSLKELLEEMQDLKFRLTNAKEEKDIQVAIIQDEVDQQKQQIDNMKRQRVEDQAEIASLREQLAGSNNIQQQVSEVEELKAAMTEKDAEIERLKAAALLPLPPPSPAKDEELTRLKLEVEELREAKSTEDVVPASFRSHLSEVYSMCVAACKALEEGSSSASPATLENEPEQAPEDALRRLCEVATAIQKLAQNSSIERKQLLQKLADAEVAATSAMAASALQLSKIVPPVPAEAPKAEEDKTSQDAHRRQAALALREVRMNAERHLAWLSKRVKKNCQAEQ